MTTVFVEQPLASPGSANESQGVKLLVELSIKY